MPETSVRSARTSPATHIVIASSCCSTSAAPAGELVSSDAIICAAGAAVGYVGNTSMVFCFSFNDLAMARTLSHTAREKGKNDTDIYGAERAFSEAAKA
jgi:hypothetical protein